MKNESVLDPPDQDKSHEILIRITESPEQDESKDETKRKQTRIHLSKTKLCEIFVFPLFQKTLQKQFRILDPPE